MIEKYREIDRGVRMPYTIRQPKNIQTMILKTELTMYLFELW